MSTPPHVERQATPSAPARLLLDGRVQRGGFALRVAVEAMAGEVIAVIGENGSGKTTLLDTIAGFAPLAEGRLIVDGATWDDGSTHLTPRLRSVALMTAHGDLFPHLDARSNVAFGLRRHGMSRAKARGRAEEELAVVGLAGHERRRPHELSSGQAQRVALARALALDPQILVLDEPLSAVDVGGAHELRGLLAQRLARSRATTFLVTHDPIEALTLADRIIVLDEGRVVQDASPSELVARPRSAFAARLVGLNVWRGRLDQAGTVLTTADGHRVVAAAPPPAVDSFSDSGENARAFAAFAPRACSLWRERPDGSPRNTWKVTVTSVEHVGTSVRVRLLGEADLVADVTLDAVATLGIQAGRELYATVKATDVTLYR